LLLKERELNKPVKSMAIYLLPNLLTTSGLFFGFLSILAAMNQHFSLSVYAIMVAMILDGLDGRVARLTGTESAFGKEFDSLADMVSFGVSPALVMFCWHFQDFGKLGWAVSFCYVAAVALRLAKFNSQEQDKYFFRGLPCPGSAAALISCLWVVDYYQLQWPFIPVVCLSYAALLAILMVSDVPYASFKSQDVQRTISWWYAFCLVALCASLLVAPALMVFICINGYVFFCVCSWLHRLVKKPAAAEARE
jgi:CDP-diacylglycerol--serine O-phosphatidyltransferase